MKYSVKKLRQGDVIEGNTISMGEEWAVIDTRGKVVSSASSLDNKLLAVYDRKYIAQLDADYMNAREEDDG